MPQNNTFDVAIVGGGLAGLSLAIQCGKQGHKVAVFEKEEYPYHKVCGEYISLESWDFLTRLGIPLEHLGLPIINKLQTSDITGRLYEFPLELGGFGISRYILDNMLHQLALKNNVVVNTNCKVGDVQFSDEQFNLTTSCGLYQATVVCAGYGKRSNLDIKTSRPFTRQKPSALNNYIGVKYHIRYSQPENTISLHNFENGYCGISNIEESKCCLCYLTTAGNLRANGNSISQMEQGLLGKNPHLKRIFTSAEFLYRDPLTISGISFTQKSQVDDHMLMLGDAAGMITPLCGNGMSMALHSAKIAYENISLFLEKSIDRNKLEENYVRSWKYNFSRRLQAGRIVQQLFGGNTSTALFLKSMKLMPGVAKSIIRLTHGTPI